MAKRYEELTISDDFMFGKAMGDKVLCRDVLERLLEDPEKLASDLDALTRAIQGLSDDLRRGAAESREGQVDR